MLIVVVRKITALVSIALLLGGCSFHGKIEPVPGVISTPLKRQPFSLAIDGSSLSSSLVNASPLWFTLTVDSGDALAESIRQKLYPTFTSVAIINGNETEALHDFLVTFNSSSTSRCTMNSCGITTRISMRLVEPGHGDKVVLADDFQDVYSLQMPGSSILINFLTGISLFVLAPVLQPISAHFAGKELQQRVTDSNDRLSFQIAKRIVSVDFNEKR